MSLRDDERAQSIQIGAVLLFAVLIILLATYQAFVVPNQNREIEAGHVDTITQQMQELRNAVVSMPASGAGRSITLTLGVEYPSRVVAVNPPTPTGAVRTLGTTDEDVNLTVANAVATHGEVDDRWTGANRTFNTGGVAYRPGYNEYQNPPRIVYENSLLYHSFRSGTLTRAGQRFVDGRQLTLITLNGSVDLSASDSVAIDLQEVSASTRQISITNETGENVTVDVASRLNASQWEAEFVADGEMANQTGGYVVDVTDTPIPDSEFQVVHVELARNEVYTLQMAKVGVGTGVESEGVRYLTDVQGDGASIQENSPTQVVVEARDAFNNPTSGVRIHGSVEPGGGSLDSQSVVTDENGRAVFEYTAGSVSGGSTSIQSQLEFSYLGDPGTSFDASAPENVSVSVTVQNPDAGGGGGGGGPLTLSWQDPSGQSGVTCPNGADGVCTVDGGQVTLTAATSPGASGVEVDFSLNDSSIGAVSPGSAETDSNGQTTTDFIPSQAGSVAVFVTGASSGDTMDLVVASVDTLVYNGDATAYEPEYDTDNERSSISFTVTNRYSDDVEITEITFESSSVSDPVIHEQDGDAHEVEVHTDSDDDPDGDYEGELEPGDTRTIDDDPTISPDATAEIQLNHFRSRQPFWEDPEDATPIDMVGEDVQVTIHYEVDGTEYTKTITMNNIPG